MCVCVCVCVLCCAVLSLRYLAVLFHLTAHSKAMWADQILSLVLLGVGAPTAPNRQTGQNTHTHTHTPEGAGSRVDGAVGLK